MFDELPKELGISIMIVQFQLIHRPQAQLTSCQTCQISFVHIIHESCFGQTQSASAKGKFLSEALIFASTNPKYVI